MVLQLIEMVQNKIKEGEILTLSMGKGDSYVITSGIPEKVDFKNDKIYIECDNLMLSISADEKYSVSFDEFEEEYIISQGSMKYSLA